MRYSIGIVFLTLIGLGLIDSAPAEVTHEEIRGTIQSLIYSYNQLDNKLERHEHRERALGELMKKAMQALQKGQKNLEPINGIFGRLDERVSQIETMLITQEEKYNVQTEKLGETLEHIFKWMRENDECYKRPPVPPGGAAKPTEPAPTPEFVKEQQALNRELMEQVKRLSANVEKLLDASKDMMEQTEVAFKSVPSTAEMLTKIEDKLVSYSIATPPPPPPPVVIQPVDNSEFENKVFEKFEMLGTGIKAIQNAPKVQEGLTLADKEFVHGLVNETLNALESTKTDLQRSSQNELSLTLSQIRQTESNVDSNVNKVLETVQGSTGTIEKFYNEMNGSYAKLHEGLEIFSKFNNILMANSEYVLDTQRKVEFGTHQVVQKISDILEKQIEVVSALMNRRFDDIDGKITSNHMEAMQNLSSLMESEISQVWHQIEIMSTEITDSKDLINQMHGKTELYVNTTFATMGGMSDKVQQITARMLELDINLNFLLGKLSVMSEEFKNIKIGLGEALDQIRETFHSVRDKVAEPVGPGPHNIPGNEYETELKLLKRDVA